MNKTSLSILLSAAIAGSAFNVFADSSAKFSVKDPGVINKERIEYWLKKRGELSYDASEKEINVALEKWTRRASHSYVQPKVLAKIEQAAQKRAKAAQQKLGKSAANTTVKVLSVLVDFPDLPYNNNRLSSSDTDMYYADYNVRHYQDLQFATGGYAGPSGQTLMTGYQYYQSESGGTFFFTGNTFGWVTADNNAATYGGNDSNNNDDDLDVPGLVTEAITKAVAANSINLADYDLEDPYDRDGDGNLLEPDGFIDHVMIYHSSVGEEAGGGVLGDDAIWSHRFFVNYTGNFNTMGASVDNSNIKLFGYTIQPIDAAVGVVVHEFGHDLGLADEYDTGDSSTGSPVSHWSVMAAGSWAGGIPGTQPVGFSPLGRDYFQNKFGGDWVDQTTLHVNDLQSAAQDHNLVEAVSHASANANQIKVNLPNPKVYFHNPYTGAYQYYSGKGDDLSNTMSFNVSLPSASNISFTMKAHWDIEKDWDFVMVKVNGTSIAGNHTTAVNPNTGQYSGYDDAINYISDKSSSIAGAEGSAGWVDLTYDLSSFAGQTVTIEFEYRTDSNTGGYGFVADGLSISADGSGVLQDGAETNGTVTLSGFSRITNSIDGEPQNYYIQLRSHNGVDAGLNTRSFQSGVVLWLKNDGYTDNKVGDHPGYGFIGVVDAGRATSSGSSTVQLRDAAFTLGGINTFKDVDDYSKPSSPEAGLVLPVHGFEMEITAEAGDKSTATVQLRKAALQLTAGFDVNVSDLTATFSNQSFGGTGALSFAWDFGDGNTSSEFSPSHSYSAAGTYTVELTITDENSDTSTVSQSVTVTEAVANPPVAGFNFSASNLTVTFTDTTTGGSGALTYSWTFGDGNSSSAQSPTHTYASGGTFSVQLTVTDSQGNSHSTTRSVTVTAPAGGGGGGGSLNLLMLLGLLLFRRARA